MDYEKKYNEALERARYVLHTVETAGCAMHKDLLTEIFPELSESEDERIVNWLYDMLKCGIENAPKGCPDNSIAEKALDWLEKQKEEETKLVQQPRITFAYNSNASRDERLKAALLALLNSDLLKVKEGGYFTKQDLIEWVERIPTDKPAWSEEDKSILEALIYDIERLPMQGVLTHRPCDSYIKFLKALRPGWKPTEEQIYSLGTVVNGIEHVTVGSVGYNLKDLYEQLKKLM